MMLITEKEAALLLLIISVFYNLNEVSCDNKDVNDKSTKQFSLFSVVTFPNEECTSESTFSGGQISGTCYSTTECTDKSGTKSGNCASGFGVCCVFVYSLLTSTSFSENRTYIQNPLYPSTETSGAGTTTTFTIKKMSSDICQIRLNFEYFVIAGPANTMEYQTSSMTDGNCNDKWATTLSSGETVPTFCGVMTGEHVYMDIGMNSADNAIISLSLASTTITTSQSGITVANAFRKYRVKTAQIPCWAKYRAPMGCHRYFTSAVGQIISPNFADFSSGSVGGNVLNARRDLMMQDLRTCIRREAGYRCILYQVCNSYAGSALSRSALGGTAANGELSVISQGWSFHTWLKNAGDEGDGTKATAQNDIGVVDGGCSTDYVEIPDSSPGIRNLGAAVVTVNSRYCGARFGYFPAITLIAGQNNHAFVYDCTEPFEVNYFTDQVNDNGLQTSAAPPTTDVGGRGLCLDYSQEG